MYRSSSALTWVVSSVFVLGLALPEGASAAQKGLVGWWKLDETSGTLAADSSGNGNNGTLQGDVHWVPGKIGGAWQGDGTGDYIRVPHNESLNLSNAVTVALWAYGGLPPDALIGKGTDWMGSYCFRLDDNATYLRKINFRGRTAADSLNGNTAIPAAEWTHITITFDVSAPGNNQKIYINGALDAERRSTTPLTTNTGDLLLGADGNGSSRWHWQGMLDDIHIYNRALTNTEIQKVMAGKGTGAELASDPNPADEATDVLRDTALSWTAGQFAATHDVYFGTVFADVNDASRASPKGVLLSQGQADATFHAGRLQFGQTYFWRVDEVNAPPSSTIYKGEVWSFTVEPVAYPLDDQTITVTASSTTPGQGPENTLSSAGLTNDQQGNDLNTMWLTAAGAAGPAWIQYQFDQPVELHELWVWNHNGLLEPMLGFGTKDVTIEYSTDGTTFQTLGTTHQFARASGQSNYAHNTTVAFGDLAVKTVKLTIQSNWGGILPQYGLSKVRFFAVPVTAREPSPKSGAIDVDPQTALSWRSGREAGSHQVFLGTDPNQLALTTTVQKPTYPADLSLGQTYYWKIAEVNQAKDPTTWTSDLWSFSTLKFLVVEDFESYTDEDGKAIWQTWIDGYGITTNGSQVGNANPPYAERTIILGGRQAMPLFYSNTAGATYSEAERTFATPQDWTKYGCKTLALSFYGDPNCTGQLYLKINSTKILYNGKAEDLKRSQWQPWNIDLATSGANLKSVTKLAIGVDGAGAAGVLRFDNIRLYPTAGITITPAAPSTTGLVAWYKFDGDFKDAVGTYTATAKGDAKIANDPVRGQVVALDGTGDGVAVPLLGSVNTLTIAMWVNTTVDPVPINFESFFHSNGWEAKDLHWRYNYGKVNADINGGPGGLTGTSIAKASQWNHVAVTVSATEFALWLNGLKEASRTVSTPVAVTLGDGMIGAWLQTDGTTISRGFTGTIDDVRFYNRALSAEELAFLAGRTTPFAKPF